AALWITRTHNGWALLGYGLIVFAGAATVTEIWKGIEARHRRGEDYWAAFTRLVTRDRHRYGGYFVHLGMAILGLGVIGSTAFQDVQQAVLNVDETLPLGPYTLRYDGLYEGWARDGRVAIIARTTLLRGENEVTQLEPRRDIYFSVNPATGERVPVTNVSVPGTHRTLAGDFYTIITFWEGNRVTFRAYWNPLINFLWMGGVILVAGTLVALWPSCQPALAGQAAIDELERLAA
ncbi:MAG: hypothetical protein JXJ20_03800, partial [Anaerolineae bacterium]|nr:hypothetical protein [Anaerolineae bacterium]